MKEYHTDELIEIFSKHSHDPITQVVCLIYRIESLELITWGVNRIIPRSLKNMNEEAQYIVRAPLHPAKKLLMKHAEVDALDFLHRHPRLHELGKDSLGVYCSLQPCLDCIKGILNDDSIQSIEWKTDNRHQEEQKIIVGIMPKLIHYQPNPQGLTLKYRFPS